MFDFEAIYDFKAIKHKRLLKQIFSNCFEPLKDELGNVPLKMQRSRIITASVLGICRAYANAKQLKESTFDLVIDAIFEDLFRRESIEVQTRAEQWLQSNDDEFMIAYYQAKETTLSQGFDLTWLTEYAKKHFKTGHQVMFAL